MKEQIGALRESGASAEEISATKAAQIAAAGIELPEDFAERAAQRETQRSERIASYLASTNRIGIGQHGN